VEAEDVVANLPKSVLIFLLEIMYV